MRGRAVILAMAMAMVASSGVAVGDASRTAPVSASSSDDCVTNWVMELNMHTTMLAVDAGALALQLDDLFLLKLAPHQVSAPGAKVVYRDESGAVIREEVKTSHTFRGGVVGDQDSSAVLTVTPVGLYGSLSVESVEYLFGPRDPVAPAQGPAAINVQKQDRAKCEGTGSGTGNDSPIVDPPPLGTAEHVVASDAAYRSYAPDWISRIDTAFARASSMWLDDVGIQHSIFSYEAMPNLSTSTDCDDQRDAWMTEHPWYYPLSDPIDHFLLVVGRVLYTGSSLCYGSSNWQENGRMSSNPAAVVSGVQCASCSGDDYNPNLATHLGLVVHHEIAHNWGEGSHHPDIRCNVGGCLTAGFTYNIMVQGQPFAHTDYWFTSVSINRLQQALDNQYV